MSDSPTSSYPEIPFVIISWKNNCIGTDICPLYTF